METSVIIAIISGATAIIVAMINARSQVKAASIAATKKAESDAPEKKIVAAQKKSRHFGFVFWMFMAICVYCTATGIVGIQDKSGNVVRASLALAVIFPSTAVLLFMAEVTAYLRDRDKEDA